MRYTDPMKKPILAICLSATAMIANAVQTTLYWDRPVSALTFGDPIGYRIYQKIGTNAPVALSLVTGATFSYTVSTPVWSSNPYAFWVTAIVTAGESQPSNVFTITPLPNPPISSPPLNLRTNPVMQVTVDNGAARLMFFSGRRARPRQ